MKTVVDLIRLRGVDAAQDDHFGQSVAIDGDVAVVGVPYDDDKGIDSGAVYVFVRIASAGTWTAIQKLTASDGQNWANFGWSVAVGGNGNTIVVGAPDHDVGCGFLNYGIHRGKAYIFTRTSPLVWGNEKPLSSCQAADEIGLDFTGNYGFSVATDGTTVVVGARHDDIDCGAWYGKQDKGAIYIYNTSGGEEVRHATCNVTDNSQYGHAVAVDGDTIVVGAPYDDSGNGIDDGSAFFIVNAGAGWGSPAERKAPPRLDTITTHFGYSVAVKGTTAVIGAPQYDAQVILDDDDGAAHVYKRVYDAWGWQSNIVLNADQRTLGDHFGDSVAVYAVPDNMLISSREIIAVGAREADYIGFPLPLNDTGAAYVYAEANRYGRLLHAKLMGSDRFLEDFFGKVAVSGYCDDDICSNIKKLLVLVGVPDSNTRALDSGAAYLYEFEEKDNDGDGLANEADDCPDDPNAYLHLPGTCTETPFGGKGKTCYSDLECKGRCDTDQAEFNLYPLACWYEDDWDGYWDMQDNCPNTYNPDQKESDSDDYGDACDCSWITGGITNSTIYPYAPEICDNLDNDCDGYVDEGVKSAFYWDGDKDGYGLWISIHPPVEACAAPAGYADNYKDCDDTDANIKPGAVEICDSRDNNCDNLWDKDALGNPLSQACYTGPDGTLGIGLCKGGIQTCTAGTWAACSGQVLPTAEVCDGKDNNCNGLIDEAVKRTFYQDNDADGFGNADMTTLACTAPIGYVAQAGDCDDMNDAINPAAVEICDGLDNNCNRHIDEGFTMRTFYRDGDADGYGNAALTMFACRAPAGFVTNTKDCDDTNSAINPAAAEVCDNKDNNCNDQIDEGVKLIFYKDGDADGDGNAAVTALACTAPAGYAANANDCNDANAAINPAAAEVCDGVDNNCLNGIDEDNVCAAPTVCDADRDGDIDQADLALISRARGQTALPGDLRDSDGDGMITPNDVKVCIPQCTRPNCAAQ